MSDSKTAPAWLKKGVLVCHIPTNTVFNPESLHDRNGTLQLSDCHQNEYKLSECDKLRLEHLRKGGSFASELAISIYPHAQGFVVTDGRTRKLVRLNPYEAIEAARSLAYAFNGNVYSQEESIA